MKFKYSPPMGCFVGATVRRWNGIIWQASTFTTNPGDWRCWRSWKNATYRNLSVARWGCPHLWGSCWTSVIWLARISGVKKNWGILILNDIGHVFKYGECVELPFDWVISPRYSWLCLQAIPADIPSPETFVAQIMRQDAAEGAGTVRCQFVVGFSRVFSTPSSRLPTGFWSPACSSVWTWWQDLFLAAEMHGN